MQAEGAHLRHSPEGEDQPHLPEHGRDPAERDLHGGHPHHDGQGHVRRQRRRARRGQPDPPLPRRHLLPREGHLLLAHHPLPRLLAGVRDRPEEGADLRQDRPQEEDPRHHLPARPRLRDAGVDHRAVLQGARRSSVTDTREDKEQPGRAELRPRRSASRTARPRRSSTARGTRSTPTTWKSSSTPA